MKEEPGNKFVLIKRRKHGEKTNFQETREYRVSLSSRKTTPTSKCISNKCLRD